MTIPALVVVAICGGITHFTTGRTPFWWIARGFILLDAALLAAYREGRSAAIWWWRTMPATIREVQREVTR